MAQRKGLLQRVLMGKDNLPDFTPDKLPSNRFSQFKDLFFGRLGAMAKINLLVILFALPIIVVLLISYWSKTIDNSMIPHSGNYGIGYPVASDISQILLMRNFWLDMQMYLLLVPCVIVLFVGLSGAFYVMRRFVWGEGVGVVSHFFHGIKNNIVPFLLSSLFIAISFSVLMLNISSYAVLSLHPVMKIIGLAVTIIVFVLLMCMAIFITTQAVTYNLKFWHLIKNSFVLAIGLLPLNLIILFLSAIPAILLILLLSVQMIGMIFLMIFLFVGISYIILMWSVYAHWVFDKFINPKIENAPKNRGLYVMSEDEKKAKLEKDLKSKNTRFNNPAYINKTIKSIDDGSTFTPLSSTFSRADLQKLQEEKDLVKNEIDADYGDLPKESNSEPIVIDKKPQKEFDESKQTSNKTQAKATFKKKK